jgi:subtilisin family serine protease
MTGEPVLGLRDFRLMVAPEPFDPTEVEPSAASATAGAQATVVQFAALLSEPDVARVKAAYGLRLDRFIPNLAYLERLDTLTADRVRADFLVRAVIPFPQASKLSPQIPATGPLSLTAILFEDADAVAVTAALTTLGAHHLQTVDDRDIGGRLRLRLRIDDAARLTEVAAIDDIIWLEPAPVFTPLNVEAARTIQSGNPLAGPIWDRGLRGEGQVVHVIDVATIDLDHCFFADVPPNKPGPGHRKVVRAFNEGLGATDHFMAVAGIVAGDELGNFAKHPQRGGAPAAKLVLRSTGDMADEKIDKGAFVFSLEKLLTAAMDVGATVHNISIGTGVGYSDLARDADAFMLAHEDQLVIAAGNDNNQGANPPPGISFNTLCVAAAGAHPNHMTRAQGEDGPTADGRRKPDLMAVGCGIKTAAPKRTGAPPGPFCDISEPLCGTSFATPNVSAAAALVRQYFQEGWYPAGKPQRDKHVTPTGALIKAVLLNSTVDMTGHPGYPSNAEGWGLIQLDHTLFFEGGKRRLIVTDVPRSAGLRMAETRTEHFFVSDPNEPVKITFVWTNRPPSDQNRAHPTVQPIRFEVEDSSGNLYLGNDFDVTNGVSRQASASPPVPPDITNNVQMVVVKTPVAGTWTIRLRPFVNLEKQGYALVVSGGVS